MPKYQQIQTVFLVMTLCIAGLCIILAIIDSGRRWDIAKINCINLGGDWVVSDEGKNAKCANTHPH
jgi:hypothetical protein